MTYNLSEYQEEDIVIEIDDLRIAGTITFSKESFSPLVVFSTGYGPKTRDYSVNNFARNKKFAYELATNGISSFRFDDRGAGDSSEVNWHDYTFLDLAEELKEIVKYLRVKYKHSIRKIGIIGHSLGATIGPLAAMRNDDIHFIVSVAPHGLPGLRTAIITRNSIAKTLGETEEEKKIWSGKIEDVLSQLENEDTSVAGLVLLQEIILENYKSLSDEMKNQFPIIDRYLAMNFEGVLLQIGNTPMYRSFLPYNPIELYENITCPILVIFAGNDRIHPSTIHQPLIENALEKNVTSKSSILLFEDASHNFIHADEAKERDFVEGYCEKIINWIKKNI